MKARLFSSIRDVPKDQWNGLLEGYSCCRSWEFWDVIECSGLNDFRFYYVLFYDSADNPVALASFYSITYDVAIFARNWLRSFLNAVRKIFPRYLKFRMLECGTAITLHSPPLAAAREYMNRDLIRSLCGILLDTARAGKHLVVVARDFKPDDKTVEAHFEALGFHVVDGLPNAYLDIRWSSPQQYRGSMKSYYRSKLLKYVRRNEAQGVRHELTTDFREMADVLCAQWLVVHNHADEIQREVLTPAFYRELPSKLGARAKALLFYRHEELVGHALLLLDGETLRWFCFGRKYPANDGLYIYVANAVVETAIVLGARRLDMGVTTYPVKQDLGASLVPVGIALRSPYWFINPIIRFVYPLINHPARIGEKNVFKEPGENEAWRSGGCRVR